MGFRSVWMAGLTALIGCWALAQQPQEAEPPVKLTPDQQAIRDNAVAFVEAFNKGDAQAVAALWAENGQMILDADRVLDGRQAIQQAYAEFFQQNAGAVISVDIASIRMVGPTIALEKGTSSLTAADGTELEVLDEYTMTHVKQDGKWSVATCNVSQRPRPYDWRQELGFLIGTWKAEAEGWTVETECQWVANENFIRRTFTKRGDGESETTGVEVIGWDPVEGAVTSWSFSSEGGFGRSYWTKDGDNWVIEAAVTTAEGDSAQATNMLTPLGPEQFRWQSVKRSISGFQLPDTEPIRVQRVKATEAQQ